MPTIKEDPEEGAPFPPEEDPALQPGYQRVQGLIPCQFRTSQSNPEVSEGPYRWAHRADVVEYDLEAAIKAELSNTKGEATDNPWSLSREVQRWDDYYAKPGNAGVYGIRQYTKAHDLSMAACAL